MLFIQNRSQEGVEELKTKRAINGIIFFSPSPSSRSSYHRFIAHSKPKKKKNERTRITDYKKNTQSRLSLTYFISFSFVLLQQVTVPDVDVFTPSTYTSDHSYSSSMNRQYVTNTNTDHYRPYHDNTTPKLSIPLADIEVIPTPQRKRKVGDTPPLSTIKILAEKPPIIPQTSSRSSSTIQSSTNITNPTQWKNTSSSTLNNTGSYRITSPPMDVDAPKLNTPSVSFGSSSNKKKSKRTKSQTRADGMTTSSSTISALAQQIPTRPDRSWAKTYGSLPDAEIMHAGSLTSLGSSKSTSNLF